VTDQPKLTWKGRLIAFGVSAVLCVAAIEGVARFIDLEDKAVVAMQLHLQPYMMFVGPAQRDPVWRNIETSTDIPSHVHFNNFGFTVDTDFAIPPSDEFLKVYAKKPGDRFILITGGSVVHGVGATANDKTTAGQLEAVLNARQSKYRYRVVNLGMGSWIAYQQFLGLSLFGLPLKPDWIVVMDGFNDGSAACAQGSGPGNPAQWPKMLYLTGGGEGGARTSPLMQWLIQNTAITRVVTGMRPTGHNNQLSRLYFDDEDPDKRFNIKLRGVKVAGLDKQVDFYLQAQLNVKELFSSANVIYSSQPLLHNNAISIWYRKAYELGGTAEEIEADKGHLKADLDNYMAQASETKCDSSVGPQSVSYFMARSAVRLGQTAAEWSAESKDRDIFYTNTEMVFPAAYRLRLPYFIDNAHLSDLGQRRIAEYFAGYILNTDLKEPFDPAKFVETVRAEDVKANGLERPSYQYSPPSKPPPKAVASKRILEGVTAKERSPGVLQLDEQKDAGFHRILWSEVPATAGKDNTLTVDAWSDAVEIVRLEINGSSGSYGRADFDLVAQKAIPYGKNVVAQVQDLGNGWKRMTLTTPFAANSFNVALLTDDHESTFVGGKRSIVITEPSLAPN
jgi:lysophospholipase L1-like esterase